MHQLTALPRPVGKLLATLGHKLDRNLPGRYRGRIARFLGPQPGRYVSPDLGSKDALLAAFAKRGIRYAVIGGQSPAIPGITDRLAIMVDDEDVNAARRMVTPWPAGEQIEAYSPSGLPGFAFGDMPLMPPRLARRLLDGAAPVNGIYTVAPRDHFFATLFRLVYLRGLDSGIPAADASTGSSPVTTAIQDQARQLGLALETPITLESLDAFLATHDWQPPLDMLERIGCWNPWVADKLRKAGEWVGSEAPGLTVFYLRQRTMDEGKTDMVLDKLANSGFRLLPVPPLTPEQLADVTAEVRGGNWGRGPFPLSGGNPGAVYVAHDPAPVPPDAETLRQFPLLDNNRIQLAKQAVRDAVHAGLPRNQRYNAMHSTDNAVQAWRAVRELHPALEPELRALTNGN